MRTRVAILTVVLATAVTACSSGSDDNGADAQKTASAPVTDHTTLDCAKFADTAKKIADAQADLYTDKGGKAAMDALVTEFDGLKEGAPSDVQAALTDLSEAFRTAATLMENPTSKSQADLAALAPKLSEDSQKVTAYVASQCAG